MSSARRLSHLMLLCAAAATAGGCGGSGTFDATALAEPIGSSSDVAASPSPSPSAAPAPSASPSPAPSAAPAAAPSAAPAPSPAAAPAPSPAVAGSATLQWAASGDSRVAGYRVYWGTSPRSYQQPRGGGAAVGTTSSHTVANLAPGRTYYFAVTAFDAAGNESDFSAEATKTIR